MDVAASNLILISVPGEFRELVKPKYLNFLEDAGGSRNNIPIDPTTAGMVLQVIGVTADFASLAAIPSIVRAFVRDFVDWTQRNNHEYEISVKTPTGTAVIKVDHAADAATLAEAVSATLLQARVVERKDPDRQ